MAILVVVVATVLIDIASGWVRRRIIEGAGAKRLAGDEILEQPEGAEISP
jgi:hypothetical protein